MNDENSLQNVLNEIVHHGKALCYTNGVSMQPMLKEEREISVLTAVNRELRCGDVVVFVRKNGKLVLHRIVSKDGDRFIIRGDNTFYDETVEKDNIIALLVGFFRKGRYVNCEESKLYRCYVFMQLHLYFFRKLFCSTLRVTIANIKKKLLSKR